MHMSLCTAWCASSPELQKTVTTLLLGCMHSCWLHFDPAQLLL